MQARSRSPNNACAFQQAQSLQPLRVVVANAGVTPGRQHAYERPSGLTQLPGVPAPPPPPARRKAEAAARDQPVSPTGLALPAVHVLGGGCAAMIHQLSSPGRHVNPSAAIGPLATLASAATYDARQAGWSCDARIPRPAVARISPRPQ